MRGGFAFDMQAVCAGFVFALAQADALIRAGTARRVMVIGAETFSRILDFTDRATCVLFGDGAGALILEAAEGDRQRRRPRHPRHRPAFRRPLRRPALRRRRPVLDRHRRRRADGRARRSSSTRWSSSPRPAPPRSARAGLTTADVDWLVPHQANLRIMTMTAHKLGVPMERVVVTVQDHGNTSAASIPLALSVAHAEGRILPGDVLLMEAIGGGLAWGAAVVRW